ncbi:MAG: hypothetical protein WAV72_24700, partial [Bradyrhizobium sp.]
MMRMAGFFPSVPSQVNFELAFAPVNGQWRLFGISVSIGQMTPTPPEGGAAPPTPPPATTAPAPAQPITKKQPPASGAKQPAKNP